MEIEKRYYAEVCLIGDLANNKSKDEKGIFALSEGKSNVNLLTHGFEYSNGCLKYTGNETFKFIGSIVGKAEFEEAIEGNELQFFISVNQNILSADQGFASRVEDKEQLIHGIFEITLKKNDSIEILINQDVKVKDVRFSVVIK